MSDRMSLFGFPPPKQPWTPWIEARLRFLCLLSHVHVQSLPANAKRHDAPCVLFLICRTKLQLFIDFCLALLCFAEVRNSGGGTTRHGSRSLQRSTHVLGFGGILKAKLGIHIAGKQEQKKPWKKQSIHKKTSKKN